MRRTAAWPVPRGRHARRGHLALRAGLTVAAAVAGAAAGLAGAPDGRPAPTPAPVLHVGDVTARVPTGWWITGQSPFAVPGLDAAAGMSGLPADAVLGVRAPDHPSLLPASLVEAAGGAPRAHAPPQGARGLRYDVTWPADGRPLTVVVAPATTGVVTLACLPVAGTAAGSPGDECVASARTIRLRRGSWLPARAEAAVRIALPAALARLNARRRTARQRLAAADSAAGRERAAASLADAYAEARTALAPLAAGQAAALPPLLTALASDHRALARAHGHRHRRLAVRAAAGIERREARLARLVAALAPPRS